ncbi:hypothetical protein [Caldibacillus phage CBP1]|uniref:Uncharacterized protein n=1 Tax=Caldibacillus debilis GB1 TaxID=1339248 RepID=A0A420VIP2_9BACI|nr:hypothetical protein [Caldibacillus debilis]ATB52718.1 hypothetical protein [Caldibacillus phage CBP1]RKO63544.1 hypothetical protein Cdeb_02807 [Caldibacillus debilis GB1]
MAQKEIEKVCEGLEKVWEELFMVVEQLAKLYSEAFREIRETLCKEPDSADESVVHQMEKEYLRKTWIVKRDMRRPSQRMDKKPICMVRKVIR